MDRIAFEADQRTFDAVLMNFAVIGEETAPSQENGLRATRPVAYAHHVKTL